MNSRRSRDSFARLLTLLAAALVALTVLPTASAADGVSRLRLRAGAVASQQPVTLGDVLVLSGAAPELAARIAAEPVFTDPRTASRTTVTHDDVMQRLAALGINPATILLEGASACQVLAGEPARPQAEPVAKPRSERRAAAAALPIPAADESPADGGLAPAATETLADRVRDLVNRDMAALGGTGEIAFESAGRAFLDLTAPFEFEIRPADHGKLGLREFRVNVKRDGRVQRTTTIALRVRLVRDTVVATRPLSIGNLIREGDVGIEQRVFDDVTALGLASIDQAVGRQVTRFVPAGSLVHADGLKSVDLVQRSKPITVLNGDGGVQMRLAGIALDAGAYGDSIRVRLGEGRKAREQVRAVVVGVNTVRLSEVQP